MSNSRISSAGRYHAPRLSQEHLTTLLGIFVPTIWLVVVLFLALRRTQGQMSQHLPVFGIVLTALGLVTLTLLGRYCLRMVTGRKYVWFARLIFPLLAVLSAFVIAVPDAGWFPLFLFFLIVGIPELLYLVDEGPWGNLRMPARGMAVGKHESPSATWRTLGASNPQTIEVAAPVVPDLEDNDFVTQRLTRSINRDGVESIAGELRANFPAGTASTRLHLAFCPPLAAVPEVFVEPVDDAACTCKVAEIWLNGARINVTLPAPVSDDTAVMLEFYVVVEA